MLVSWGLSRIVLICYQISVQTVSDPLGITASLRMFNEFG